MNFLLFGIVVICVIIILYCRYLILVLLIPKKISHAINMIKEDNESIAIEQLSGVLKFDRGNPDANWIMAEIYMRKDQFVLAQMYLYDILHNMKYTNSVSEVRVRETLAYLYLKVGDFNKAMVQYFLLKKKNKLTSSALKNSIRIALKNDNFKQSETLLKIAKSLDKNDGELDYFSAVIDFNHFLFSAAERKLKIAVDKGFINSDVDYILGKIYFFSRKYNLAMKHFAKVSSDYLNTAELESFIGQCSFYLKDYSAAIEVLEKFLIDINKNNNKFTPNIEYILGLAYEATGDVDHALDIWKNIRSYASSFQPVKEKMYFYNNIAKQDGIKEVLSLKMPIFIEKSEKLINMLDFNIKSKLFEDEKNLEYLCLSNKNESVFNLYYIVITRKTSPISVEMLNNYLIKAKHKKTRSILIIAPYFNDHAISFAKRNGLTLYTFDIYQKKL